MKTGFDPDKYIIEQSKYILERVNDYDKLYLEFGGKLFPTFTPSVSFQGLTKMQKSNYFSS